MKNGFIKVGAAMPRIRVADTVHNAQEVIRLSKAAEEQGVRVLVFPELCLTGYTCADLFYQNTLINGAETALETVLQATCELRMVIVIGLPVAVGNQLYNCAAVCSDGKILGLIPKTELPGHGEFSEGRWFAMPQAGVITVELFGKEIPFGRELLFTCREIPELTLACEICEDLWSATPPSCSHTAAGATVICNPSASNETVGKREYRRLLVTSQSARTVTGYIFASAGAGESTTDLVFGGHCMICENGKMLAERVPFDHSHELTVSELDVQQLTGERRRINATPEANGAYHRIFFSLPVEETVLTRPIDPHPFLPADLQARAERCETILSIQSTGLAQRVERAYAKKLVLGISGGLDSTLALLVMVRAMDALNRPRKDILAVTMPCFGTTKRTKSNATVLCEELGVDFRCVDIFDAVNVHFRDIGHDPDNRNVTYENSQARERTQILMDIANDCGGMVIGTGDLSELALGWATYNGDHMSMYSVNGGIPKTLVRHIVAHCADAFEAEQKLTLAGALRDILDTPVSPELLPADEQGNIAQKTEDLVGPYELHDFYLYHMVRHACSPAKLHRLAKLAFAGVYDDATLCKWLSTFVRRFFNQQFKRSCLPDGPKVGSVGLSPRGDLRMPSDACAALWLAEAEALLDS